MKNNAATLAEIEAFLIRELAMVLCREKTEIAVDTPLYTLGVDSLRFVELLIAIEKQYGVKLIETGLSRRQLQNIHTLATHLHQHLTA